MSRLGSNGRGFASSTGPRMKTFTPTAESVGTEPSKPRLALKGEFAPVYVVLGMVLMALSIGAHTAKQQLMHAPAVNVSKKKRESVPEVEDPDQVVDSADKFLNKSFLRKLAHVQEHEGNVPDPIRGEVYTRPRQAETLKSVGVAPARQ